MHWIYEAAVLDKLREVDGSESGWKTTLGKKEDPFAR